MYIVMPHGTIVTCLALGVVYFDQFFLFPQELHHHEKIIHRALPENIRTYHVENKDVSAHPNVRHVSTIDM